MRHSGRALPALLISVLVLIPGQGRAEQGFENCAAGFPDGSVQKAPKRAATAAPNTVQICERSGAASFFALEYDPGKFAPLWVAYRIADTFGANGCASMTRDQMRCHFQAEDVEACIAEKRKVSDPFHPDALLAGLNVARLGTSAFSGTGHDRGHMGPNSTFSWHACGAYKTFTMANMAAQWGSLNQQLWANLEAQVLFWGVKHGPVYVVTGPIWSRFPSSHFDGIKKGRVDTSTFPKPGELLQKTGGANLSLKILRPTGFYKVVFRPGGSGEPGRAIAFLVPHTKERGLSFWEFVSTVSLVEESSGLRFGFSQELKNWPDLAFWRASGWQVQPNWSPRTGCTARLPVAGWIADRPLKDRIAICASSQGG